MSLESKIDRMLASQATMHTQQAVIFNDIKHIIKDNAEFKESTNKAIGTLKTSHYKTKADVGRLKWIATGIASGVSTLIGGAIAYFKQ